ncbi:MAG: DUF2939 domain-containing protein [Pseudomonadota bacterium]
MRKLIVLALLLVVGFYVGWPAYSGYAIKTALDAGDADALARKVDFPQVRQSIRGPVLAEIQTRVGKLVDQFGPLLGLNRERVRMDDLQALVGETIDDVVTPRGVIDSYQSGRGIEVVVQREVMRRIDRQGGLTAFLDLPKEGGDGETGAGSGGLDLSQGLGGLIRSAQGRNLINDLTRQLGSSGILGGVDAPKGSGAAGQSVGAGAGGFGIDNIKSFAFDGPLAMEVGVARDVTATRPDVTATMAFEGFDWRLTRLVPQL